MAIKRAQILAIKEPLGLLRTYGKRPDRTTQIPWARGKQLTWTITVPGNLCRISSECNINPR